MDDRYRVDRVVERGGMSEILEAYVVGAGGFERRVAIKRLLPRFAEDRSVHDAFLDEARIVSQLSHDNIVQIFDFGTDQGRPFQVLEFVDGADLHDLVQRAAERGEPMPVEVALHVVSEVARALAHAHEARDRRGEPLGIVHRDVTPRNILLDVGGAVKLSDFGVAYAQQRLQNTNIGTTKGTLQYMAPEQGRGEPVDARTDVFALGCVLHWCLSGQSPLSTHEARMRVYSGESPRLHAELPDDVLALVGRATAPRAADRYPSAQALAEDIWVALRVRAERDTRALVREWVARLRREAATPTPAAHRVGALFDLDSLVPEEDIPAAAERPATARAAQPTEPLPAGAATVRVLPGDPDATLIAPQHLDPLLDESTSATDKDHAPEVRRRASSDFGVETLPGGPEGLDAAQVASTTILPPQPDLQNAPRPEPATEMELDEPTPPPSVTPALPDTTPWAPDPPAPDTSLLPPPAAAPRPSAGRRLAGAALGLLLVAAGFTVGTFYAQPAPVAVRDVSTPPATTPRAEGRPGASAREVRAAREAPPPAEPGPPRAPPTSRTAPPPPPARTTSSFGAQERQLEAALTAAGLARDDLASAPETQPAYAAWRAARARRDADAGAQALARLLPRIRASTVSAEALQSTFQKLREDLQAAARTRPAAEIQEIEERYLGLRAQLRPELSESERRRLFRAARALSRRLRR